MTDMPKFSFSECEFQDDAELQKALEDSNKGSKFFQPGKYEVTVEEVIYKGLAKDPNWGALEVHYKGTGEKVIKDFLNFPFKDVQYHGAKGKSLYPFKKVTNFCKALGVELKRTNLEESMKTVFGRPEKLKGTPLNIEIGYQKAYVKYAGKENDQPFYNLVLRDGNVVRDASQEAVKFMDRDAATAFAAQEKIDIDRFPSVLAYEKSSSSSAVASGW